MDGTLFHSAQPRQKYTFNFDLLGGRGGQVLLDVFAMVLYFTNTGVRKVVVNKNAILHSWSLVDLQTLPCRCYNSCFCSIAFVCFLLFRGGGGGRGEPIYPNARTETLLVDALVQTIGIFGTDRAYRPRDRYTDHWEL